MGINPESFSAVRVDYKASISLEYKGLFIRFDLSTIYNVTENPTALKAISNNTTTFLLENVKEYFTKLETVDFSDNEIFKSLYDKGIWDFSQSSKELDDVLKHSFKEYLASKKEFKDIEITYNDVDLMTKSAEGNLNSKNKGYDGITDNYKQKALTLSNWIGRQTNGWEDLAISTSDFVKFYCDNVGTIFSQDNSTDLSLGLFIINWNYINIYGMGLSGNVQTTDGENLVATINLSQPAIDKKLSNWGKIIITFIKYYGGKTIDGVKNIFGVTDQLFKEISRKNQKNGLKDVIKLLVDDFKGSDDAKDLGDLDLFNFMVYPQTPKKYPGMIVNNHRLFWDSLGKQQLAVLFTFGEEFNTGLYYSIASSDGTYDGNQANELIFSVEPKANKNYILG